MNLKEGWVISYETCQGRGTKEYQDDRITNTIGRSKRVKVVWMVGLHHFKCWQKTCSLEAVIFQTISWPSSWPLSMSSCWSKFTYKNHSLQLRLSVSVHWRLQILNSLAACRIWFVTYNNIKICFQDISESHQAMNTSKISLSWSPKSWWYPRWSQTLQYHPTSPWKIESIEHRIDTWSPKIWIKSYQAVEGKVNAWYEIVPWSFKDRHTSRGG